MIFIGDIAIPQNFTPDINGLPSCFSEQTVVANLEGAITQDATNVIKQRKLFSAIDVIPFLQKINVKAVSLANNHITDVEQALPFTCSCLDAAGIAYCGAGFTKKEASKPVVLFENDVAYVILSFGWDVISCKYVSDGRPGVNPLEVENVLKCVREARVNYPNARIVLLPHWDYEMEKYPMPMHRELAKAALDAGAEAIFGHHPHCVQGIELYKGKPIVYSLGNWFIPHGVYMSGKVKFPLYAHLELAVEWNEGHLMCHWFEFQTSKQQLCYIGSEDSLVSERIQALTPFSGMDAKTYYKWFRKNRAKKKMHPIYRSSDYNTENIVKGQWIKLRQACINFLFDHNIKKNRSGVR